jgi:hypothetical protein
LKDKRVTKTQSCLDGEEETRVAKSLISLEKINPVLMQYHHESAVKWITNYVSIQVWMQLIRAYQ